MMVKLLGIDEAGRGPVIGPLVLAGVLIEAEDEKKLRELGVKDSKLLTPAVRLKLFEDIKRLALDFRIKVLSPAEVDRAVLSEETNLNWLEAGTAAAIIKELNPDKAIVDSPSVNTNAIKEKILSGMGNAKAEIICKNKADLHHPVVSAASIIAKVTRDREIGKLKKKFGVDFGSGYPSDPFTMAFLKENFGKYPFFRRSWASYKNAASSRDQTKLGSF